MPSYTEIIAVVGVCFLVLGIVFFRKNTEFIVNFILRAVFGIILIYFTNQAFTYFGISAQIGINLLSVLTCGSLGIPGICLLYGITFFNLL